MNCLCSTNILLRTERGLVVKFTTRELSIKTDGKPLNPGKLARIAKTEEFPGDSPSYELLPRNSPPLMNIPFSQGVHHFNSTRYSKSRLSLAIFTVTSPG